MHPATFTPITLLLLSFLSEISGTLIPPRPPPTKIEGIYELEFADSYKYDKYLKAIGVSYIQRKLVVSSSTARILFERIDEDWSIVKETPLKEHKIKFRIGEQFKEETDDGRWCLSRFRQGKCENGVYDQLVNVQKCIVNGNMYVSKVIYQFEEDQMKAIMEAHSGESVTQVFRKIKIQNEYNFNNDNLIGAPTKLKFSVIRNNMMVGSD